MLAPLKRFYKANLLSLSHFSCHTGAILFEGFDVNEGIEFQEVIQSYNPDLSDEYRGTSPRKLIPGTKV